MDESLINKLTSYPFPESNLFSGSSCAIIGNSGILLESELGSEIDSHDFIIRFAQGRVKGFETHVGSRTSLRFINIHCVAGINNNTDSIRDNLVIWSKFSLDIFKELDEVNYVATPDVDLTNVSSLYPNSKFSNISTTTKDKLYEVLEKNPTTGLIAVLLSLANFKNISCYGFDFYGSEKHHYWEDSIPQDRTVCHSLDEEKEIMYYLKNNSIINFK
jgi:hypothetical protein|tara:strand:+ start:1468 stop:2118 length:651 start_codon:yes stop_codon:yes gene_type:complete